MTSKNPVRRVKGMQDILPDDRRYWDSVETAIKTVAPKYGFNRIDLPIIEYTELFEKGTGTGSDFFVQKEMYTLQEPDGSSITIRPEFTPGFMRAYLQNGMHTWSQPVKLYTLGPAFRRERPQAGRFRQHSQFNAEIIGEIDPAADLEVMMLASSVYRQLGYKNLYFQLNSTGCAECKPIYVEALKAYLSDKDDQLAAIDKERLERNALRVLDSKEPGMDELLKGAPKIKEYLCDDCEAHFADLRSMLDGLDQSYVINNRLVRGIDYYTKTVFEVWAEGIGAQAAICGGGRYDGLAEDLGGPSTPGVGFGSGIERIILGMKEAGISPEDTGKPSVLVAHFGGETKQSAIQLLYILRQKGIRAILAFARNRRSLKSQMREANRLDVDFVLIMGEDEVANNTVAVKPMDGQEQVIVKQEQIGLWLAERLDI